mmetsp:Transcript_11832/g.21240  ORF Transcript_11832/g.21240 Transcript_11832/m.21240 type:complete len:302 (-) Transcript_11832:509-1414(-)
MSQTFASDSNFQRMRQGSTMLSRNNTLSIWEYKLPDRAETFNPDQYRRHQLVCRRGSEYILLFHERPILRVLDDDSIILNSNGDRGQTLLWTYVEALYVMGLKMAMLGRANWHVLDENNNPYVFEDDMTIAPISSESNRGDNLYRAFHTEWGMEPYKRRHPAAVTASVPQRPSSARPTPTVRYTASSSSRPAASSRLDHENRINDYNIPDGFRKNTPIKKNKFHGLQNFMETDVDDNSKIFHEDECVICCHSTPELVFMPCRHKCVCTECYFSVCQKQTETKPECVLCRNVITDVRFFTTT